MSPKLTISYHPQAKRVLEEIIKRDDPASYSNIVSDIEKLSEKGLYPGVLPRNKLKKLRGQKKNPNPFWRLREGDWRVVFAIKDNEIKIVWIGRKDDDIYKKFTSR